MRKTTLEDRPYILVLSVHDSSHVLHVEADNVFVTSVCQPWYSGD